MSYVKDPEELKEQLRNKLNKMYKDHIRGEVFVNVHAIKEKLRRIEIDYIGDKVNASSRGRNNTSGRNPLVVDGKRKKLTRKETNKRIRNEYD